MSKILIFYATAGIGHKKAAFAIKEAFDAAGRKDVLLKDALDYTNAFFKRSYCATYLFLIKRVPTLWGFFYYILDNPLIYTLLKPIRRLVNYINSKRLVNFLLTTKPKTVIVTHFLALEVIANLKRKGILDTRLVVVVTDYKSHTFWISKYVDSYIVASDYTREDLLARGIDSDRIKVFGIPCEKKFSAKHDITELKTKMGLALDKKTIFILSGGFGVGPIANIVLHLDKLEEDFQAIVVCGYNKKLYEKIEKIAVSAKHVFKVYGFVNTIDEMMAVSDVLVSKPGGISVTEALNASVPMIVMSPIPGQEMRNYKFLEKNGAALRIQKPERIEGVLKEVFASGKMDALKEAVKRIRYTNSAERIVNEISQ